MPVLKERVPILGNIVDKYYTSDLGNSMKNLFFIVLQEDGHEYLLGTSSPMTLFITPPDLDKIDVNDKGVIRSKIAGKAYEGMTIIKRKGQGHYFNDVLLFDERPTDFKNYLFQTLSMGMVSPMFSNFQKYIRYFENDPDINIHWESVLNPIYSNQDTLLKVNGIGIMCEGGAVKYFADKIAKIPYRINSESYVALSYSVDKVRDYDYLLPLTKDAFEHINVRNFKCFCQEKNTWIEIKLFNEGKEIASKRYVEAGPSSGDGVIVDFTQKKYNLGIGLFPNILSANEKENNYFKLMFVTSDGNNENVSFTVKNIECFFIKDGHVLDTDTKGDYDLGVKPSVVRTLQSRHGSESSSMFYEVFNTDFDAFSLIIKDGFESSIECSIVPIWDHMEQNDKSMTYAIDLGTTNTYISCRETDKDLSPDQLTMVSPMVSYLQEPIVNRQMKPILCIEGSMPEKLKPSFDTEFVPVFIDGTIHKFPIRTALCKDSSAKSGMSLFDNTNIAFFYEKQVPNGDQEIDTDVKWSDSVDNLRIFIREILLIIKCNVLKSGCSLTKTNLVWFRPLSFRGASLENYQSIWQEEAKRILNLGNPDVQVLSYTESEAPYYYFKKANLIKSKSTVAIVDIGGGSTDIVYFDNSTPKLANSVHFGCDVLWGNGFNSFTDARENGIYQRYKDVITFKKPELRELNERIKNSKLSTKDIIDFWISYDSETQISKYLRNDFKPYFLYHFTSIIYYMGLMFKNANLKCPRVITFSGNGSRYIDQYLIADTALLTVIVKEILKEIFSDLTQDVLIVLPDIRKESTCYGGLYRKKDAKSPKPYTFAGSGAKEYPDVKDLASDFNKVLLPGIKNEILKMNKLYQKILGIMAKEGEINSGSYTWATKELDKGIDETLKSQFQIQVLDKYSKEETYNDSLFFLPIIDALFNMSRNINQQVE